MNTGILLLKDFDGRAHPFIFLLATPTHKGHGDDVLPSRSRKQPASQGKPSSGQGCC